MSGESTAYLPRSLMAAPLVHDGRILGVLEVPDPVPQSRTSLNELALLALFARQAAIGLRVIADRHAREPAVSQELGQHRPASAPVAPHLGQIMNSRRPRA
jgi:hypothetical protein